MRDIGDTEKKIQAQIMLEAPKHKCVLMRNSVGTFNVDGRWVKAGLPPGSSDLIGWTQFSKVAVFTAVEVKKEGGRVSDKQQKFIDAVNKAGGIGIVAYSVEAFVEQLLAAKDRHGKK